MHSSIYLTTLLAAVLSPSLAHASSTCNSGPPTTIHVDSSSIHKLRKTKYANLTGSACGCTILADIFPSSSGAIHFPGSETYTAEQSHYWSATARLLPKCVFTPSSAKEVSIGITAAKECESEFSMRGGGHMPVVGAANTDSGILFGMSKFKRVELNPKKNANSVYVGAGTKWGDVYRYLAQYGLYAIGGRLSSVGVPGLILGGGINYFSNKYGFAMDNVLSFEVVRANGDIVTATASNKYRDLFWALKGGAGQFGIVTQFELKTHQIPYVWTGLSMFAAIQGPQDPAFDIFYSAITNLTNSGYDERGVGLISQIQTYYNAGPDSPPSILGMGVVMHEGNEPNPPILKEFQEQVPWMDIPGMSIPSNVTNPVFISEAMASLQEPFDRHLFHVESSDATPEAVKTMHEVYFRMMENITATIPSFSFNGIAIQGIPASAIAIGESNPDKLTGNSFGLEQGKAQIWYDLTMTWGSPEDDAAAEAWAAEFGTELATALKEKGLQGNGGRGFLYLNDAQGHQDVFSTYGAKELKKLKEIREKYDPEGKVFGKNGLAKGGFKF